MTAQIKLKHSGGNGVIIEAPASNPASDKTITLPSTESGVFATKDSANSLQNVTGINSGQLGNRRLNINGAMLVNQRGNETGVNSNVYSACDRYNIYVNKGTYTVSQSTDAPNGFSKSLKLACTSAESLGADGFVAITYRMEGLDCTPFQAGTPDAKQITLSFWIRSNLTGQFQVNFENENNAHSSGADGINSRAVSILSANTWEKKVVTMPGDTAVALDTTTTAKQFCFDIFLSAGTNYTNNGTLKQTWQGLDNNDRGAACTGFNLASSTNNFVEITGVQLEIGDHATEFEHRSYGQELALCQRYCQISRVSVYENGNGTNHALSCNTPLFAELRASPTATLVSATHTTNVDTSTYIPSAVGVDPRGFVIRVITLNNNATDYRSLWKFEAEL